MGDSGLSELRKALDLTPRRGMKSATSLLCHRGRRDLKSTLVEGGPVLLVQELRGVRRQHVGTPGSRAQQTLGPPPPRDATVIARTKNVRNLTIAPRRGFRVNGRLE